MKNDILDALVFDGEIKSYSYEMVEEEPGSHMRESEELTLVLLSGRTIKIGTVCSGSMENTSLLFE